MKTNIEMMVFSLFTYFIKNATVLSNTSFYPLFMMQSCKITGKAFEITDEDLLFYEKMGVPPPTICPEERLRRRYAWKNMRNLYHRTCSATGKKLISNYSADKPFPVFEKSYWFSNNHNALTYGRDFDFSRPFFEQFKELQTVVPRFAIQQQEPMENSEYCNFASNCKNSYLVFDSDFCEDAFHSYILKHSKTCSDSSYTWKSEVSYELIDCENCFDLKFSQNCKNCSSSWFLKNCIGCSDCFGSVNLRNKKYYFSNQKCTKEEYEKKLASLELNKYSKGKNVRDFFSKFASSFPHKAIEGIQNENVSGNHISHSRNAFESYNVSECWDIAYCDSIWKAKNCRDVSSFGEDIEMIYECSTAGLLTQLCAFCFTAVGGSGNLFYCDTAYSSRNCFGCIGIQRAEYCILNKQYSKEEYFALREKIIDHMKKTGEWGEFFPIEISPFGYNETVAQEYFPLTKEEVLGISPRAGGIKGGANGEITPLLTPPYRGRTAWNWKDDEPSAKYEGPKVIIPDTIVETPDSICDQILECEECAKNYRIVKPELKFYRQMNLPIPHKCPNCRHKNRMKLRNPRVLYKRSCGQCGTNIETTYAPERPEKVLCEKCYEQAVN